MLPWPQHAEKYGRLKFVPLSCDRLPRTHDLPFLGSLRFARGGTCVAPKHGVNPGWFGGLEILVRRTAGQRHLWLVLE